MWNCLLETHNLSTYFELAQLSLECSGIRCCSRKNGGGEVHEIKRKIVEYICHIYIWINSNLDNQIAIYFGSFLGRHICQYCHHTSKLRHEWWQYWQIHPSLELSMGDMEKLSFYFKNSDYLYQSILFSFLKIEAQMTTVLIDTSSLNYIQFLCK